MNKIIMFLFLTRGDCRDKDLHSSNSGLDLRELQDPVGVGGSVRQEVSPSEGNDSVFGALSVRRIRRENDGLVRNLLQH